MLAHLLPRVALVTALSFGALATESQAQGFGVTYNRHNGHNHIGVSYGNSCRPDRYEIIRERVWVPGCTRNVWQPAQYETRYNSCGQSYRICVRPAGYVTIQDPGRYEWRERRVRVRDHGQRRHRRGFRINF